MWCDPKAILCEIHQCFKSFLEVCELCWEHPLEYCPRQARGEAHRESKACCYLGALQKGGKFACNKETNFRVMERSLFWTPVGMDRKGKNDNFFSNLESPSKADGLKSKATGQGGTTKSTLQGYHWKGQTLVQTHCLLCLSTLALLFSSSITLHLKSLALETKTLIHLY